MDDDLNKNQGNPDGLPEEEQPAEIQPESESTDLVPVSVEEPEPAAARGHDGPSWAMFAITSALLVILSVAATYLVLSKRFQAAAPVAPTGMVSSGTQGTQAVSPDGTPAPGTGVQPTRVIPTPNPTPCQPFSIFPTPDPVITAGFPPVSEADWVEGAKDAPIVFTVYSDFQCPYCIQLDPVLKQLLEKYPDDVQVVFRHFPLTTIHDKAHTAAVAAEAAAKQDKFFEMKEFLFSTASQWNGLDPDAFRTWLLSTAVSKVELDKEQFEADLDSPELKAKIDKAIEDAMLAGVGGTPFLLFNGQPFQANLDFGTLDAIVQVKQLEARQYAECPAQTIDVNAQYLAEIETSKGKIVIELLPKAAPITVNNFVFLAEEGWYDNNQFFRVIEGTLAQVGDPTNTGLGNPGFIYRNEITELGFDSAGVVGMASSGPDTNGSQFFITMQPLSDLNGYYTVFGKVIEGLDVVGKLNVRDAQMAAQTGQPLPDADVIESIKIIKK